MNKVIKYINSLRKYILLGLIALTISCQQNTVGSDDNIINGVDLDLLFAAPTALETTVIEQDWASRDIRVINIKIDTSSFILLNGKLSNLEVLSHTVGGLKHYGAVITPYSATNAKLPILCYLHGGDAGVSILEIAFVLSALQIDLSRYIIVVPSFQGEPLIVGDTVYLSEGADSPWDYDVDDALALLNATINYYTFADSTRIGLLGFSRGAGVALLMAIRNSGIDRVVEISGPTDFLGEYVQEITREALQGIDPNLPGFDYLNATFLSPLVEGTTTIGSVRLELIRRSAVYFASRLPNLQIHHGRDDDLVAVSQAESLEQALIELGTRASSFEVFLYDAGGHNPLQLQGSLERAGLFLNALTETPLAAAI